MEKEINKLNELSRAEINNLLVLKSAYSIIDEMFAKEMENADLLKQMTIRKWLFCGFGIKDIIIDPKKLSTFVEDVMDPYGRQDKIFEETQQELNKNKTNSLYLNNEILDGIKMFNDNSEIRYKEMQKEYNNFVHIKKQLIVNICSLRKH